MRKYEAVFILDPRKVEGDGEGFSATIEEAFKELGGTVERVKCLERKTFARPIGRHTMGIYWDYVVSLPPQAVAELKDKYRLNQTVLRLVVFNFEDGQDDSFFNPPENRAKLFQEDFFGDSFDHDDRPYRSYGGNDEN
ncbi:MAG: 30S ribosomal protein S6 [Lentisphaeria bacterium]|nr:30S ribosomal protein S6 [Victivallales bacterium]MBR6057493.1 30S ribosomal protein S6 [Victivallales bacterium]MCR4576142.1 30S ribosomal protein S6 [Lentisphaeria bacterium]